MSNKEKPDGQEKEPLEDEVTEDLDGGDDHLEKADSGQPQDQAPDKDDVQELESELDSMEQEIQTIQDKPGSGGKGLAGTALVASLVALAGTGYNLLGNQGSAPEVPAEVVDYAPRIETLQQKIQSLGESQDKYSTQADKQIAKLGDDLAAIASRQAESDQLQSTSEAVSTSSQSASQPQAQKSSEVPTSADIKKMAEHEINQALAGVNTRLGLNEAAQLLSIGEQQLSLARDVSGAKTAFGLAKDKLSGLDDSQVAPVIESVTKNIAALDAVNTVDKAGLTQKLGQLSSSVDALEFMTDASLLDAPEEESTPPAETGQAPVASQSGEQSTLDGMGSWLSAFGSSVGDTLGEVGSGIADDLKGMVSIQKTGPMTDVVLGTEEQYFVRENMKLMLGSAQRAVLQDNAAVYQQNLAQAQDLLSRFFDSNSETVKTMAGSLTELSKINLEPELPDVSSASASLSALMANLVSAGGTQQK